MVLVWAFRHFISGDLSLCTVTGPFASFSHAYSQLSTPALIVSVLRETSRLLQKPSGGFNG